MKRRHLFELEDLDWWPAVLRDATTDYLVTAIRHARVYDGLAPKLADAVRRCGATRVVDLCSGAGGPWPTLLPALRANGTDVPVTLTDKFPNVAALERVAKSTPGIDFEPVSVGATAVPERLGGFRTLFTAFHHFRPSAAKAILAAAVADRQGVFVAEATSRTPAGLASMFLVPAAVWVLTPVIRPFRWSRLLWTYLVPVVPAAVAFDGVVSCLRTYTPDELRAMGEAVSEAVSGEYEWEAGWEKPKGSSLRIPYLIGVPRAA